MSKITISVDSPGDLDKSLLDKYGIKMIHMGAVIGDDVFRDCQVKPEMIYNAVEKDNQVPKTNAALEIDYQELFEEATKNGGSIIHFSISSSLSATIENARRAAQGLNRVHIVDTKQICLGTGHPAIVAKQMADQGKTVEEILNHTTALLPKIDVSFIINDLKYLYRGGRVSGLKLLGANLLKIRPSMQAVQSNGKIIPSKKYKGEFAKAVSQFTQDRIAKYPNADKSIAYILHTDISQSIIDEMVSDMKKAGFKEIIVMPTGITLTIQCGRNMIGNVIINS